MFDADVTRVAPQVNSRMVRQFSFTLILLTCALVWKFSSADFRLARFGSLIVALPIGMGVLGLLFPSRLRVALTLAIAITHPIGSVVSIVILGTFFFLVFTPLAVAMRVFGRDKLALRQCGEKGTYWKDHIEKISKSSYFRQS